MTQAITPNQVVQQLAGLARDLDTTVRQLEQADRDAAEKRAAFDLAFSRAYLSGEGSIDARKHQAVIATIDRRMDAEVAEALVRHLRRRIDATKTRIDVGRSYGAALRAEISLAGVGDTP